MRGPGSIRRDRVIHIFLQVLEEHKLRVLVFHVQGRRFLPAPGELTEGIHHVKSGILARIGKPLLDALRDIRVGYNNIGSREILQGDLPDIAADILTIGPGQLESGNILLMHADALLFLPQTDIHDSSQVIDRILGMLQGLHVA